MMSAFVNDLLDPKNPGGNDNEYEFKYEYE